MPVTDLNETVREADQAVQARVVREIMSKVDQAVEASSSDEPVFATCAKTCKEWQATISKNARITLAGTYVDDLWFVLQRPATGLERRGTTRQAGL